MVTPATSLPKIGRKEILERYGIKYEFVKDPNTGTPTDVLETPDTITDERIVSQLTNNHLALLNTPPSAHQARLGALTAQQNAAKAALKDLNLVIAAPSAPHQFFAFKDAPADKSKARLDTAARNINFLAGDVTALHVDEQTALNTAFNSLTGMPTGTKVTSVLGATLGGLAVIKATSNILVPATATTPATFREFFFVRSHEQPIINERATKLRMDADRDLDKATNTIDALNMHPREQALTALQNIKNLVIQADRSEVNDQGKLLADLELAKQSHLNSMSLLNARDQIDGKQIVPALTRVVKIDGKVGEKGTWVIRYLTANGTEIEKPYDQDPATWGKSLVTTEQGWLGDWDADKNTWHWVHKPSQFIIEGETKYQQEWDAKNQVFGPPKIISTPGQTLVIHNNLLYRQYVDAAGNRKQELVEELPLNAEQRQRLKIEREAAETAQGKVNQENQTAAYNLDMARQKDQQSADERRRFNEVIAGGGSVPAALMASGNPANAVKARELYDTAYTGWVTERKNDVEQAEKARASGLRRSGMKFLQGATQVQGGASGAEVQKMWGDDYGSVPGKPNDTFSERMARAQGLGGPIDKDLTTPHPTWDQFIKYNPQVAGVSTAAPAAFPGGDQLPAVSDDGLIRPPGEQGGFMPSEELKGMLAAQREASITNQSDLTATSLMQGGGGELELEKLKRLAGIHHEVNGGPNSTQDDQVGPQGHRAPGVMYEYPIFEYQYDQRKAGE